MPKGRKSPHFNPPTWADKLGLITAKPYPAVLKTGPGDSAAGWMDRFLWGGGGLVCGWTVPFLPLEVFVPGPKGEVFAGGAAMGRLVGIAWQSYRPAEGPGPAQFGTGPIEPEVEVFPTPQGGWFDPTHELTPYVDQTFTLGGAEFQVVHPRGLPVVAPDPLANQTSAFFYDFHPVVVDPMVQFTIDVINIVSPIPVHHPQF
jgi:hypothetical protein